MIKHIKCYTAESKVGDGATIYFTLNLTGRTLLKDISPGGSNTFIYSFIMLNRS
jgi:hypothetical protein